VLLLDEPLGALDHKLRLEMQVELKELQRACGITFVFVTHDQPEALTMSDRIAVFSRGRIEQVGTPWEVYERPATGFVARFLGASNLLPALVEESAGDRLVARIEGGPRVALAARGLDPAVGSRVAVMLRPEWLCLSRERPQGGGQLAVPVEVGLRIYQGAVTRWTVNGLGPDAIEVTGTPARAGESEPGGASDDIGPGERGWVSWRDDAGVVLRDEGAGA
jgi:spermidine/putrescine transport system ATP-binding protein